MRPWRLLLATVLCACSPALAQIPDDLAEPGQHPASAGFVDPDDISVLLDYRLPSWWSREWDARLHVDGASRSEESNGTRSDQDIFNVDVDSRAHWQVEGERNQGHLSVRVEGMGRKSRSGNEMDNRHYRQERASSSFDGLWRRYFTDRWFGSLSAGSAWNFQQSTQEYDDDESLTATRSYEGFLGFGGGFGRLRDVTPTLRAARLNERLVALGRAPLAREDVLRVASGLARQAAYSGLFARPDRRFWADVLAPVAAGGGLAPFETFYLAEVLQENVGARYEGWQIDGALRVEYEHLLSTSEDRETWVLAPQFGAAWSHNFSLDHQFSATGLVRGSRRDVPQPDAPDHIDYVLARVRLEYLWVVADRCLWTTALDLTRDYQEYELDGQNWISRAFHGELETSCAVYLEDRVALVPSVSCRYDESGQDDALYLQRNFTYALVLRYDLDRTLN